jgi:hypothetical protein
VARGVHGGLRQLGRERSVRRETAGRGAAQAAGDEHRRQQRGGEHEGDVRAAHRVRLGQALARDGVGVATPAEVEGDRTVPAVGHRQAAVREDLGDRRVTDALAGDVAGRAARHDAHRVVDEDRPRGAGPAGDDVEEVGELARLAGVGPAAPGDAADAGRLGAQGRRGGLVVAVVGGAAGVDLRRDTQREQQDHERTQRGESQAGVQGEVTRARVHDHVHRQEPGRLDDVRGARDVRHPATER